MDKYCQNLFYFLQPWETKYFNFLVSFIFNGKFPNFFSKKSTAFYFMEGKKKTAFMI